MHEEIDLLQKDFGNYTPYVIEESKAEESSHMIDSEPTLEFVPPSDRVYY